MAIPSRCIFFCRRFFLLRRFIVPLLFKRQQKYRSGNKIKRRQKHKAAKKKKKKLSGDENIKRWGKIKRWQKSKAAAKNKMATIFRFSSRNSRLNCWVCSKIFIVYYKLIGHIYQKVSADFVHFFPLNYLVILKLWLVQNNQKNKKCPFLIIKCGIPLILHVLCIRRNILLFNIKVAMYSFKWSNDFYSFAVLTFYDLFFLNFIQFPTYSSCSFDSTHPC